MRFLRAQIRREQKSRWALAIRNPIENKALVVGGILAVGIAAAIIFWPKKAAAATPQPTTPIPLPQQPTTSGSSFLDGILPPGFKFDRDHVGPDPFTPVPWGNKG